MYTTYYNAQAWTNKEILNAQLPPPPSRPTIYIYIHISLSLHSYIYNKNKVGKSTESINYTVL